MDLHCKVIDAKFAHNLAELRHYSCIRMKIKYKFLYTLNPELDYVIFKIVEAADKGAFFLKLKATLQDITVKELMRRDFIVDRSGDYYLIQYFFLPDV